MSKHEQKNNKVSIKLTNAELVTQFHPAITSLASLKLNNLSAILNVVNVKNIVDEKVKNFFELRKKIAEQGCVKDDDGVPVLKEGRAYTYKSDEDKIKSSRLVKELEQKKVSFKVSPLKISDFTEVESITPATLLCLKEYIKK